MSYRNILLLSLLLNPRHSRSENTCLSVLAMTMPCAKLPEQAMPGVMTVHFQTKRLVGLHPHANFDQVDRINEYEMRSHELSQPWVTKETSLLSPILHQRAVANPVFHALHDQVLPLPCAKQKYLPTRSWISIYKFQVRNSIFILTSRKVTARCSIPYVEDHRTGISRMSCFTCSVIVLPSSFSFSLSLSDCIVRNSSFRFAEDRS